MKIKLLIIFNKYLIMINIVHKEHNKIIKLKIFLIINKMIKFKIKVNL